MTIWSSNGVGISESDFVKNLVVSPNPTDGAITVDLGELFSRTEVLVMDITGKEIYKHSFTNTDQFELFIDADPATYILELRTSSSDVTRVKVVIY